MKKYTITIEEIIDKDFEIEANSKEEARQIVEERYKNNDIIVDSGEVTYKQMYISENQNSLHDDNEWISF